MNVSKVDMEAAQGAWDDVFGHLPGNLPLVVRLAQHFADHRSKAAHDAKPKSEELGGVANLSEAAQEEIHEAERAEKAEKA